MNKFFKILFFSIIVFYLKTGPLMATPLSDSSLQDFFNSQGWAIDAQNDQAVMPQGWIIAETSAQASMSFWRETSDIAFGIYSLADGQLAEVFDVGDTPVAAATVSFNDDLSFVIQTYNAGNIMVDVNLYSFKGKAFGFYIAEGLFGEYTNILYSDPLRNPDEKEALLLYNPSAGQFVFAGDIDGDQNFSDITAQGESIAPIPEPATMVLLCSGLIGLAGLKRKGIYYQ